MTPPTPIQTAPIPMQSVGPLKLSGGDVEADVMVPLATYETPLWPSVERGARVTAHAGGIVVKVLDDRMARSVLIETDGLLEAIAAEAFIRANQPALEQVVAETSRFARLLDIHTEIAGNLLFLRFAFSTGDASGHNMATRASDALLDWILQQRSECRYVSVSGNICCDKKVSAINGLLGRGKRVCAEARIPAKLVSRFLHTTPEKIERLNWRKNWVGSTLAGSTRSANAHYANMLLAFYLATGQDAANIVEGSQGFTLAEARGEELYFSCTLPNLILGAIGNGKDLPFVQENLQALGCAEQNTEPGANAKRLAAICAATVLCGELSLLAALTNPGELMNAHVRLERNGR